MSESEAIAIVFFSASIRNSVAIASGSDPPQKYLFPSGNIPAISENAVGAGSRIHREP
jgi:hypothetical protein